MALISNTMHSYHDDLQANGYSPLDSIYVIVLFLVSSLSINENVLYSQWEMGFVLISVYLFLGIKKLPFLFKVSASLFFIYALSRLQIAARVQEFLSFNQYYLALASFALFQYVAVSLISLFWVNIPASTMKDSKKIFCTLSVLNSIYVISGYALDFNKGLEGVGYSGFLDYAGINGTLIAATVPMLVEKKDKLGIVLSLLAIYFSKSSIPFGVLGVGLSSLLIIKLKRESFKPMIMILAFILFFLNLSSGKSSFDSAYRFDAYKIFMSEWLNAKHFALGTGPGSFWPIAFHAQMETGFMNYQYWFWNMHSDWLQILFENGIVGLLLVITFSIVTIKKLNKKKEAGLVCSCLGILSSGIFSSPLRYFPFAFFIGYIFIYSQRRDVC